MLEQKDYDFWYERLGKTDQADEFLKKEDLNGNIVALLQTEQMKQYCRRTVQLVSYDRKAGTQTVDILIDMTSLLNLSDNISTYQFGLNVLVKHPKIISKFYAICNTARSAKIDVLIERYLIGLESLVNDEVIRMDDLPDLPFWRHCQPKSFYIHGMF